MYFNFQEIFTVFMVIPIIIDLRKKAGHIQSEKASLIAGVILIAFLFLGKSILNLIGIDVSSFAIAGAFILFFIALEMILGITLYKDDETTLLSLRAEYYIGNIIIAVILNVIVIYIVLKTSRRIERFIGQNGINIIRKIFGVILLAIAVKLFAHNIKILFA